jgi:uncharacterized membrane protein
VVAVVLFLCSFISLVFDFWGFVFVVVVAVYADVVHDHDDDDDDDIEKMNR